MRKLNVFTDFHHAGLLNSLILLFEGRFGGSVYRPIGTDWHTKGYWKVYDHPATVEQFLGIGGATPDGTPRLNDVIERAFIPRGGLYYCKDIDSDLENKAITLDVFFSFNIDIVIASIPQHIPLFRKLCNEHSNKPKLIYQIGNAWNLSIEEVHMVDGIMSSAKTNIGNAQHYKPYIEYHQEFDTNIYAFDPAEIIMPRSITSFVNCFTHDQLFARDYEFFQYVEKTMPDYSFRAYGGQCRDGAKHGSNQVAQAMRDSAFIWHVKNGGDGYGHVLHSASAVGRPIIYKKSYYEGKLGGELLIDGLTGIDIENKSADYVIHKIRECSDQDRWSRMCYAMYNRFREVVNFDIEAQSILLFLEKIL